MATREVTLKAGEDIVLRTRSGRIITRIRYVAAPAIIRKSFPDNLYLTKEKRVKILPIPKEAMKDRPGD